MTLSAETLLENRYQVHDLLGQGGMGAIYRGFDTKLKIPVAIKENFFRNRDSVQQFEQEGLLLARLRHANLPRVIDHFSHNDHQYLVMDFIEGQDLWEIIEAQGHPLTEMEALQYITQICQAVAYLHEQEPPVIHRDIKPQNIKITPKGQAVLVDFGIAKIGVQDMLTGTAARGVTPGFSPPEQYSGTGTSPQSDIYALGATLYAILTSQKPPDSIKLITGEAEFEFPDPSFEELTAAMREIIQAAMQIRPTQRPQSVAAWQAQLTALLAGQSPPPQLTDVTDGPAADPPLTATVISQPSRIETGQTMPLPENASLESPVVAQTASAAPPPVTESEPPQPEEGQTMMLAADSHKMTPAHTHRPSSPLGWWVGGALVLLALILVGSVAFVLGRANSQTTVSTAIVQPPTVDTEAMLIALAATVEARETSEQTDDHRVDYAATITALQRLGTAQAQPEATATPIATVDLAETVEAAVAATSQANTLADIPLPTATVVSAELRPNPVLKIAFQSNRDGNEEIYSMNRDGSGPINLTNYAGDDRLPAWSPDGRHIAFTSHRTAHERALYVAQADGTDPLRLLTDGSDAVWSPDGNRLAFWTRFGGIQQIASTGGEVMGLTAGGFEGGSPSWSPDGLQLVYSAEVGSTPDLFLINVDGSHQQNLTNSEAAEIEPAWSPDGEQLAFISISPRDPEGTLYLMKLDGSKVVALANQARQPAWSPDGQQLAFASKRDGNWEIYQVGRDGANPVNLTNHPADDQHPAWGVVAQ